MIIIPQIVLVKIYYVPQNFHRPPPITKVNDFDNTNSINHIDIGLESSGQELDRPTDFMDNYKTCPKGENGVHDIVDKDLRGIGQVDGNGGGGSVKNENDSESSENSNCENEQQSINNILTNVYA